MPFNRPIEAHYRPLFSSSAKYPSGLENGPKNASMRTFYFVRLPKYGLFGLIFKRSPNRAPIGISGSQSGLNAGPDEVMSYHDGGPMPPYPLFAMPAAVLNDQKGKLITCLVRSR